MAGHLRAAYEGHFKKPLRISEKSLAVEVYMHYKFQVWFRYLEKGFKNSRLLKRLLRSTAVIDCGEKSCDTNRFVWDFMARFVRG